MGVREGGREREREGVRKRKSRIFAILQCNQTMCKYLASSVATSCQAEGDIKTIIIIIATLILVTSIRINRSIGNSLYSVRYQ